MSKIRYARVMSEVSLLSLATATPPNVIEQRDVAALAPKVLPDFFRQFPGMIEIFNNAGIERRRAVRPLEWYLAPHDFRERSEVYLEEALKLYEQVARDAIEKAQRKTRRHRSRRDRFHERHGNTEPGGAYVKAPRPEAGNAPRADFRSGLRGRRHRLVDCVASLRPRHRARPRSLSWSSFARSRSAPIATLKKTWSPPHSSATARQHSCCAPVKAAGSRA